MSEEKAASFVSASLGFIAYDVRMDQHDSLTETTLEGRVAGLEAKLGKKSNVVSFMVNFFTILIAVVALVHSCRNTDFPRRPIKLQLRH